MPVTSIFKNINDTKPKEYELDRWLRMTINPPERLKTLVDNYRNSMNQDDKLKIPLITISSRLKGYRSLDNVEKHLPFICLDIDRWAKKKPCNLCVDMLLVKEMFMNFDFTYYCGFSTSGDGIYAIIKLGEVNKLNKYFQWLQKRLARVGVNIDSSCIDATRLRFFSVDTEAYFNPDAKPLIVKDKPKAKPIKNYQNNHRVNYSNEKDKVEVIISKCKSNGIDITASYDDWIKIGAALWNEFGENGRDYFHALSSMHSEYDYKKCDKKFDNCKKLNKTSIASLYSIAGDYGVMYSKD